MNNYTKDKKSQHQERLVLDEENLKDLSEMYLLCKIDRSSGQGMVIPQDDGVPGIAHGTTEREERRIQVTAVAHHPASAAKIRAAVGTTHTQ
ncbi:hypothetical protein TNCV_3183881 [Trichonephila clavipes]|nr:hypothetical protein TNCV_3183881 [Trichonephila clavipes]